MRRSLRRARLTLTNTSAAAIEGYLPLTGLEQAAATAGVRSILPIYTRIQGSFVTPAIGLFGTYEWQAAGFKGAGIRVGILDGGFDGIVGLLGEEIPRTVDRALLRRCRRVHDRGG